MARFLPLSRETILTPFGGKYEWEFVREKDVWRGRPWGAVLCCIVVGEEAMVPDLSERETRLLEVLVHIVDHILCRPEFRKGEEDTFIDTSSMSAGESSLLALEQYGLATLCLPTLRLGQWTDTGQNLRAAMREKYASETFKHVLPVPSGLHDPAYTVETALGISQREAM